MVKENKFIFLCLLLLLLISACERSPQLDPNTISKPDKIKQGDGKSSFILINTRQKETIGIVIGYLEDHDYYMLIVISNEPLDAIYLDGETKIKLTKKADWFDSPFALISESLMEKLALSTTISTGQTKFETSKELYQGINLFVSEINIILKERTDYDMDW